MQTPAPPMPMLDPEPDTLHVRPALAGQAVRFVAGVGGFFAAIPVSAPLGGLLELSTTSGAALLGGAFVLIWAGLAGAVWGLWRGLGLLLGRHTIEFDRSGLTRTRWRRTTTMPWGDVQAVETRHVLHEDARRPASGVQLPELGLALGQAIAAGHWVVAYCGRDSEIELRSHDIEDPDQAGRLITRWSRQVLGIEIGDLKEVRRIEVGSSAPAPPAGAPPTGTTTGANP